MRVKGVTETTETSEKSEIRIQSNPKACVIQRKLQLNGNSFVGLGVGLSADLPEDVFCKTSSNE